MRRILIVDNNTLTGQGISHILETNGYNVVANESTGANAISSSQKLCPELIIIDMHLPDKNGLEIIRNLREAHHDMKIIVMTAYNNLDQKYRCRELGVEGYILKYNLAKTLTDHIESIASGKILYEKPEHCRSILDLNVRLRMLICREKLPSEFLF